MNAICINILVHCIVAVLQNAQNVLRNSKENILLHQKNELEQQKGYIQRGWIVFLIICICFVSLIAWQLRKNKNLIEQLNNSLIKENKELIFEKRELEEINKKLKLAIEKKTDETTIVGLKIPIKLGSKTTFLNPNDIQYIKAEEPGAKIIFNDSKYTFTEERLKTLIPKLDSKKFIQIYRSTVVNVNAIDSIESRVVRMVDGTEHIIGPTFKSTIIEALAE